MIAVAEKKHNTIRLTGLVRKRTYGTMLDRDLYVLFGKSRTDIWCQNLSYWIFVKRLFLGLAVPEKKRNLITRGSCESKQT